jgi:hypothetical protein
MERKASNLESYQEKSFALLFRVNRRTKEQKQASFTLKDN